MSRNIFDLDQILGNDQLEKKEPIQQKSENNTYSKDTILQNYEEIPREEWPSIENRTYIRYTDLQGNLKKGCSINSVSNYGDNMVFQVYSRGMNGKYNNWHISSKNIEKIYKYKKAANTKESPEKTENKSAPKSESKKPSSLYPPPQENALKSSPATPEIVPINAEISKSTLTGTMPTNNIASKTATLATDTLSALSLDIDAKPNSNMHIDIINKKIENLEIAFQKLTTRVNSMVRVINAICERLPKNNV